MQIKLLNVRLSFPDLFKPKSVNGSEPKYAAAFLLDKTQDAAQIARIRTAMKAVAAEKFGATPPKGLKVCLHEGAEKEYDGYTAENMYISTSAAARPTVIDRDMTPLTAEDNKPYAGCFVNAVIRLWAQDNQYGKRINAQIQGVQFVNDGDAFGADPFKAEDHFAPVEGGATSAEEDPFNSSPDDETVAF